MIFILIASTYKQYFKLILHRMKVDINFQQICLNKEYLEIDCGCRWDFS